MEMFCAAVLCVFWEAVKSFGRRGLSSKMM